MLRGWAHSICQLNNHSGESRLHGPVFFQNHASPQLVQLHALHLLAERSALAATLDKGSRKVAGACLEDNAVWQVDGGQQRRLVGCVLAAAEEH